MGLLGCIFMVNTLLFCLVYWGLCIVAAPNDDAKIHTVRSRWSRSVRYSATVLQFEIGYTKVKKKNFISIYLYIDIYRYKEYFGYCMV